MKIKLRYGPDEYFTLTRRNTIPLILLYLDFLRSFFLKKDIIYLFVTVIFGTALLCIHMLFFALPILGSLDLLMATLKFIGDGFDKLLSKNS